MMSLKLAMYATSECLPAGHGNVMSLFICRACHINVLSLSDAVQAMQSKPTFVAHNIIRTMTALFSRLRDQQ